MAFTLSTTNPPRLGQQLGQFFIDIYPQVTAGASGNVITLSAQTVISVIVSGIASGAITWSYAKPTLTIAALVNAAVYDIWVVHN